jgi:hypothetical protein
MPTPQVDSIHDAERNKFEINHENEVAVRTSNDIYAKFTAQLETIRWRLESGDATQNYATLDVVVNNRGCPLILNDGTMIYNS